MEIVNQNPNLPLGITVGSYNNSDIFCLDSNDDDDEDNDDKKVCYNNIPGVHRLLSNFDLNDYKQQQKVDGEEEEEEVILLTLEDRDNLIPGMWLKCLYDINDSSYYEAMFITSDATQMNPNIAEGIISYNTIGIEYDEHELDEGEDAQKWVPISWCMHVKANVVPCNINQSGSIDDGRSQCDYLVNESMETLFHRAFKDVTMIQQQSNEESCNEQQQSEKVLFTYSQNGGEVVKDEDTGYLKMGRNELSIPTEMDTSSYTTIYSHLPFFHPLVIQLDHKFKLFQLYKNDPLASKVFPKSFVSYKEALGEDEDSIFYIKESGSTRGEGITIKTWYELREEYQTLKEGGEYDVDEGEEDVIVQRAVSDLYTIDGDGPIAGRRFDIRFFVLIAHGKAWLHSNLNYKWSLGPKYDPKDTNIENHLINLVGYSGGDQLARLFFVDSPLDDANGNSWSNSTDRRRKNPGTGTGSNSNFDPHGWRDAVADALDDASGLFTNLKELTKTDTTKYVLVGGDALIKQDGSAVILEFNIWPDLAVYANVLTKCLANEGCRPMVLMRDGDSNIDIPGDNYVMLSHKASGIVSSEGVAEVLRDTVLMVMQIQSTNRIKEFREIMVRN